MQYSTDGIFEGASDTPTQEKEMRHQIRRMAHHPSIVVWSGCNECGGIGNLMNVVAQEDQSRVVRAASPALGWTKGVHTLTGHPNGNALVNQNHYPNHPGLPWPVGESHGPYAHGGIFPSVNGGGDGQYSPSMNATANTIAQVQNGYQTGPAIPGYFVSETGVTGFSSFESMSATLSKENYGVHTKPFHQRNYPCDNWIYSYFRQIDLNLTGARAFQKQLYFCMFAQGLHMKAQVESWRANNIWGMLLWQYNEIWPTGGWGSIEYGTPVDGQVIGGRWKPLQHFLQASGFADVTASCGKAGSNAAACYVRNDLPTPQAVAVRLEVLHFATGAATVVSTTLLDLPPGAGTVQFFCAADGTLVQDSMGKADEAQARAEANAGPSTCGTFDAILNTSGCASGQDCLLNLTVFAATFPPRPPPPFPTPTPAPPHPAPAPHPPAPPSPPTPPLPPPSRTCNFLNNTDSHGGGSEQFHGVPDQYSCCGACQATKGCALAVYYSNVCYLRSTAGQTYTRPGRVSCVVRNTTQPSESPVAASAAVAAVAAVAPNVTPLAYVLGKVLASNMLPLVAPGRFRLPVTTVTFSVGNDGRCPPVNL